MAVKKLIEVALPLEAINAAAAREKSIRHGHPSTLHLWWARRPLAAARAVIWSSLVDDPSSHPEQFPTEEDQARERERLFKILEELVVWENSNDPRVLDAAKAEIKRSMGDDIPPLLDPFAGGGAIPLEAQRLGLEAYAQDLNPVAVTINKAMIEIPPRFQGIVPINPDSRAKSLNMSWEGNTGLAADVEYYGNWMKKEAFKRIGHLYPKVRVPEEQCGGEATVIAWIWARTVKCPNPACGCEAPLVRSFDLSKKKGKEWHVEPLTEGGRLDFKVVKGKAGRDGTVNRRGATCIHCGAPIDFPYIRSESCACRMGEHLMAVVGEGERGRLYISPSQEQVQTAAVPKPEDYPQGAIAYYPGHTNTLVYGLDEFHKLFTNRQLTMLTTFGELVREAQSKATEDALAMGMPRGSNLVAGGSGAMAYGEAIGVYLAFLIDKLIDLNNALNRWEPIAQCPRQLFARQAIPMVWDHAEANPFSSSSGSWSVLIKNNSDSLLNGGFNFTRERMGAARQFDAQSDNGMRGILVSTDPPYYDNIGYADLSDFFYVWLRQSLRSTYPELFSTMLVPKMEELVATPYRDNRGIEGARNFFEEGMFRAFQQVNKYSRDDVPVTIYYAFKQSETETENEVEATASTGWETMLSAIIRAGFSITGTWPVRTENGSRAIAQGSNALASSIVLVCRKRDEDAGFCTRREFVSALKRELRPALDALQQSNIAPVDLAQSAIGPGMGIYSRYNKVLEADGSEMTVRSALQIINQELDLYFSDQDSDIDRESRLCVDLYTQFGYNTMRFGEADVLARAKNTSIQGLQNIGVIEAGRGNVRLRERGELPEQLMASDSCAWLMTQQLVRALEQDGISGCAKLLVSLSGSASERAKALAYRLYTIAERRGWTAEGLAYNSLIVAWPEIQTRAAQLAAETPRQQRLFDLM